MSKVWSCNEWDPLEEIDPELLLRLKSEAIKSGKTKIAIGLLAERLATQSSSGPTWLLYASELEKIGANEESLKALLKSKELLAY